MWATSHRRAVPSLLPVASHASSPPNARLVTPSVVAAQDHRLAVQVGQIEQSSGVVPAARGQLIGRMG